MWSMLSQGLYSGGGDTHQTVQETLPVCTSVAQRHCKKPWLGSNANVSPNL